VTDQPSPGAEPSEPRWKKRQRVVHQLRAMLVERFPAAFKKPGEPKPPLMIGVSAEIMLRCPELTRQQIGLAMNDYCGGSTYLRSFVAGAHRVDLDGNPVSELTQGEIENAQLRLRNVMDAWERRQEKTATTEAQRQARAAKLAERRAASDEAVASLREMVDVYQDQISGGVPMSLEDQPRCIQRAMAAIAAAEES
jgi:sRNA-binding protein